MATHTSKPGFTSLTETHALYNWVKYLCTRSGMQVKFFEPDARHPTPYTTKTCVHIPYVASMSDDAETTLRYGVLHEAAGHHDVGEGALDLVEKKLGKSFDHPLMLVSNIIEDWRIEYVLQRGFKGDRGIIDRGRALLLAEEHEAVADAKSMMGDDDCKMDGDSERFCSLSSATKTVMAEYLPSVAAMMPEYLEAHPDSMHTHINKLTGFGLREKLYALDTVEDMWSLSEQVYALLWDKTDQQVKDELAAARAKAKAGKDGDDGEDGEEGEGKGKKKVHVNAKGEVVIPWNKIVPHDHSEEGDPMPGSIDYTGFTATDWTPYPPDKSKLTRPSPGSVSHFESVSTPSRAFINKVRMYLQDKTAVSYEGGHKSGSIRAAALWRGGVPVQGTGEWNSRVFKRPSQDADLDVAVTLLVDYSGSMSGEKVATAASAAMHLAEVFRSLHVPFAVRGFSTTHSSAVTLDFKGFREVMNPEKLYTIMAGGLTYLQGNADADNILLVYHEINTVVDAKRKLIVVLSDGCPADAYDGCAATGLQQVVGQIEEAYRKGTNNVEIIGIGIRDTNVKRFYKTHTVIDKLEELEPKLLGIVTKHILHN